MKRVEVVAAIIQFDGKILCVQRGSARFDYIAYKYEFPGGKVERDETTSQALIREVREELDLRIAVHDLFLTVDHAYPDFHITMHSYLCSCKNPDIKLNEHVAMKWLGIDELSDLDWAAADLPIVNKLQAT
jgi:8-oxo-dGTP diphosphatase